MGTGPRGLHYRDKGISRWDQVDFAHAVLHVRRAKKGVPSTHPIRGDEVRALRKLQRGPGQGAKGILHGRASVSSGKPIYARAPDRPAVTRDARGVFGKLQSPFDLPLA